MRYFARRGWDLLVQVSFLMLTVAEIGQGNSSSATQPLFFKYSQSGGSYGHTIYYYAITVNNIAQL